MHSMQATTTTMHHCWRSPCAAQCRVLAARQPRAPRQCKTAARSQQQYQGASNPLAAGLVFVLTEALRVLGIGQQQDRRGLAAKQYEPAAPGDVNAVVARIRKDFTAGYFITGIIDEGIYEADCQFEDPTVAFSGLQLWKRNLALLVPFLLEPRVLLLQPVQRLGRDQQGAEVLQAEWSLDTGVSLPWRPIVSIKGSTTYTLNADSNRVVRHVEAWNVTAVEALGQLLRPASTSRELK